MNNIGIEEFGRLLVEHVRDRAIIGCDLHLRPDTKYSTALAWKDLAENDHIRSAILSVIPDIVDKTILCLLSAIDQEILRLHFASKQGKLEDLVEDGMGELGGWYLTDEGWASNYSKERLSLEL